MKQIHLVVKHPSVGEFVARKLDDPTDRQKNNALLWVEKFIESRFPWKDSPTIIIKEIDDEV